MEKTTIQVEFLYELEFDKKIPEFQQALKDYQEVCVRGATENDMLKHIVFYINRFGCDRLIEGVGYVWIKGKEKPKEMWCGVIVTDGEPDPEVDFY